MREVGLLLQCLRIASLKTKKKSITLVLKVSKPLKKLSIERNFKVDRGF
jgi:hypothetical protein